MAATLLAHLGVVESGPLQEAEDVEVCPGEVVAHKELAASLFESSLQPGEGAGDELSHQLSHQLQLLLLVSLEHGHDPLVDDIVDGVDYLVRLSPLEVGVAGQTVFVCQKPAEQKSGCCWL